MSEMSIQQRNSDPEMEEYSPQQILDILKRKAQNLIRKEFGDQKDGKPQKKEKVTMKTMRRYATCGEKFLYFAGISFGFFAGCLNPTAFIFIGKMFSNFNLSPEEEFK